MAHHSTNWSNPISPAPNSWYSVANPYELRSPERNVPVVCGRSEYPTEYRIVQEKCQNFRDSSPFVYRRRTYVPELLASLSSSLLITCSQPAHTIPSDSDSVKIVHSNTLTIRRKCVRITTVLLGIALHYPHIGTYVVWRSLTARWLLECSNVLWSRRSGENFDVLIIFVFVCSTQHNTDDVDDDDDGWLLDVLGLILQHTDTDATEDTVIPRVNGTINRNCDEHSESYCVGSIR